MRGPCLVQLPCRRRLGSLQRTRKRVHLRKAHRTAEAKEHIYQSKAKPCRCLRKEA